MLKVTELARKAGVTSDAIRHYVRIGLIESIRDPGNNYRLFSAAEVNRVRFINQAQRLGYTLEEIRQIFEDSKRGRSPCPRVRQIIQQRIEENKHRLEELNALQQRMEQALQQWRTTPDGAPDGDAICHLIESVGTANDKHN